MLLNQLLEAKTHAAEQDLKPRYTNWPAQRVLETFFDKEVLEDDPDNPDTIWTPKPGLMVEYEGFNITGLLGDDSTDLVHYDSRDREYGVDASELTIYQTQLLYRKS